MTLPERSTNNDIAEVTFPSALFPGPPTIGLRVPATWKAISPSDYVQPMRKVDMAVCGPEPIDGVTPSIVASVLRTLPLSSAETFLTELFEQESKEYDEVITSRYHATPRPTMAAVCQSQFPGKRMKHLQILSYIHSDHLAHIVNITGVYAAGSKQGKETIFTILEPEQPETHQP